MIPANDFRRQWEDLREDAVAALERVGSSGWYVLGEEVKAFEAALASHWGLQHAAGVASGLDAIEISLRILGCKPGDRVLTTPLSAFATTLAIAKLGAVPVFVDTDECGLIDLARCRALFERRPDIRYFVPVHLYGQSLNPIELRALRDEFDLQVVEDCAQSIGAAFQGQPTGTAGQLAATSFYPTKNLGAMGDGGAILTNEARFDAQARVLRFYGETARYRHEQIGYNSRLDELQASVLLRAVLPRLAAWTARRRAIAQAYFKGIRHAAVRMLKPPEGCNSCWHLFPVFVKPEVREVFLAHLHAAGVGTGIHYPVAIPDQRALAGVPNELADHCSTARRLCASEVSLPIHPYLTDREVGEVIEAVNGWQTAARSGA
jgi:dTDP-3-amino-3,4,6-trideoxy-alpha-D-glucose transaminase